MWRASLFQENNVEIEKYTHIYFILECHPPPPRVKNRSFLNDSPQSTLPELLISSSKRRLQLHSVPLCMWSSDVTMDAGVDERLGEEDGEEDSSLLVLEDCKEVR